MAHDEHDHGFAHPAPISLLLGTFIALCVLTALTLLLAGNLGPFGFLVAMIIGEIAVQGRQHQSTETPSGGIGPLNQFIPQYNLLKEALGQVLGFFVAMALAPEVTVHGLPVVLQ